MRMAEMGLHNENRSIELEKKMDAIEIVEIHLQIKPQNGYSIKLYHWKRSPRIKRAQLARAWVN